MMKKIYCAPTIEVVLIETQQMIAFSLASSTTGVEGLDSFNGYSGQDDGTHDAD